MTRILPILLLLALALPAAAGADPKGHATVVGGQDAAAQNWPSIAFLFAAWDADGDGTLEGGSSCTGTVVKPDWVLTAAHCAFRPDGQPIDAMVSLTGVANVNDPAGEAIAADQLVVHPDWNPSLLVGDAMLVHLARSSSRPPMPLAVGGANYFTDAAIPNAAGWGTIDEDSTIGTDVLQEAYLTLIGDDAICAAFASDFDPATQTCAGSYDTAGVCHGDSGGPLTVLDGAGVPHLWGLTSYGPQLEHGMKPCDLESPAIFTWVPAYAQWVDETTKEILPPPPPPDGGGPGPGVPGPRPGGPVPGPGPLPSGDRTPPVLSGAKLSAKKLRSARKGATIARKTGAKLSFRLSEAAAVRISVLRGSKTLSPGATLAAQAGKTSRTFTGRIGKKALKPGRYKLQLTAVDAAGNAARPVALPFRIVR